MPRETTDNSELRNYLLGSVEAGSLEQIEERLMTDDEFFEDLLAAEEDLIQDYVDEDLSTADESMFENHFLNSPERQKKFEFARALRSNFDGIADERTVKEAPKERPLNFFQRLFAAPLPAMAGLLVLFTLSSLAIWNFFFRAENTADLALASLNKAYQTERPLESRITGLDYAPLKNTRGGDSKVDPLQLDLAKVNSLTPAAAENPTAENLHAAGRFYLTQKDFEAAITQLEKAEKLDPDNAQIQNDLGVGYFEKSRLSEDGAEVLDMNEKSLSRFDRARQIDPKFSEALFNKAIVLQKVPLPRQAKNAWEEYLKLDPNSQWADEARRNLQILNEQTGPAMDAKSLETEFIRAQHSQDGEKAFRLISQNRELIKEKYLPQRLAMSFVNSDESERHTYLEALRYLGRLEKNRIQDSFAADLAGYYGRASPEQITFLRSAHDLMKRGFVAAEHGDFPNALENFNSARSFFFQAQDPYEANTFSAILIGYCLNSTKQPEKALEIFEEVEEFTEKSKYVFLHALNSYWLSGVETNLGKTNYFESKLEFKKNLEVAENIGDLLLTQTILLSLALKDSFVNQDNGTKTILKKLLQYSSMPEVSARQKTRNYGIATELLVKLGSPALSKGVVLEGQSVSQELEDDVLSSNYLVNTGIVHTIGGDYQNGEQWLKLAETAAQNIQNPATKEGMLAKIFMYKGHLDRARKSFDQAAVDYDEALKFVQPDSHGRAFEIKKSRLLAYKGAGNFDEVDKQLPEILNDADKYRTEIRKEQDLTSFFDRQQSIYEIATENELRKGNTDAAYNFAESSRSRSLLNWLEKGASANQSISVSSEPMNLREIQTRMPDAVQILQYTVLPDRILIWSITRDSFDVVESDTDYRSLKTEVDRYLELIRNNKNQDEQENLSRSLYLTLISPIVPKLDSSKFISIIPDKLLIGLPFVALADSNGKYLIENFKSFYSPSANVLVLASEKAAEKGSATDESLLSIGNPDFDKQKLYLQDLPAAEIEAKTVSNLYENRQLLIGSEATEERFLTEAPKASIIHFAGHYVVENGLPGFSGLVMAKGKNDSDQILTNAELKNNEFALTKLIILAACETGAEAYSDSEGLIGLSRTFLETGIPVVVGSQWKVDSDSTSELMIELHRLRRQENLSTIMSLRSAQLELINSGGEKRLPYYWSGFGVLGGYAGY